MRNDLGVRLRQIRASRNQQEMAEVMGVAKRTYASYERNERVPDALMLVPLIEEGWSGDWLLTGRGHERPGDGLPDSATAQSQDLSLETLKLAVQTVEEARQIVSLSLSPEKAGEVVSLVYQLLCSGLAEAEIIPITRQALKVAKGEAGNAGGSTATAGRQAAGSNR